MSPVCDCCEKPVNLDTDWYITAWGNTYTHGECHERRAGEIAMYAPEDPNAEQLVPLPEDGSLVMSRNHELSLVVGGKPMATATQSASPARREEVTFAPNVPVTLSLRNTTARPVGDGSRVLFVTGDNRSLFLDLAVAQMIEQQTIQAGEAFTICKQTDGKRGSPITWKVERVMGAQPNGTFVAPAAGPVSPKPPASAAEQRGTAGQHRSALVEEACRLVDDFAAVLEHGLTTYNGRVKPDEIQRLFTTVFISRSKHAA